MISPWLTNSLIDSCAFDPKYAPEDAASTEIFKFHREKDLPLVVAHSTLKEIEHPNTPSWVKHEALALIYSLCVQLTANELRILRKIESILAGNGKVENIAQDARHVFEAQKLGPYFITTDCRILKRADALRNEVTAIVLKPSEFLALARQHMQV